MRGECLVIRGGAFGDVLMASSVLPGLAARFDSLTLLTSAPGEEVLRHDPHLARIWVAPHVPDGQLGALWDGYRKDFASIVNLTHGMEWQLIAHPLSLEYHYSDEQRRRVFAGSYLERYHFLAGVPGPYRIRFYPSIEERQWAERQARDIGPFVVWSLRGSSIHKTVPAIAPAIAQVLARSELSVVIVGGPFEAQLGNFVRDEVGQWTGQAHRVFSLCNEGTIRHAMALAPHAEVVVGPETAVPMAVAHEDVPKVLILSHSARSNTSDDWYRTTAIVPDVPCYPCHRLHRDFTYCVQDPETQAAACAASITADRLAGAVLAAVEAR